MAQFANLRRSRGPILKEGDKTYLLRKPANPDTPVQTNPPDIDPSSQTPEDKVEAILEERLVKPKKLTKRRKEYFFR